jgi:peroxiredoxin
MSQAEIAGSRMTLAGELPEKGRRFPDLELTMASGCRIHLSDYRGRSNLVPIFTDDQRATAKLLSEMAGSYARFRGQEAEIIAIAESPKHECARIEEQLKLPFSVLSDEDGRIHHVVGASDLEGHAAAAAYVTDRYGEVFAVYRTRDGQHLPRAAEILDWLEFISIQCPECEPPEWPA